MGSDLLIHSFFLIFACSAILATIALYSRQPLIVVYIIAGIILGPSGTALISDPEIINSVARFGIIFLLFLLGLDMQPSKLIKTFRKALLVGLTTSLVFFIIGFLIASAFGYAETETVIIGVAMMFSSTIIGIKLLPTTVLHHRQTGEIMISLLLIQDLIAILVLLIIGGGLIDFSGAEKIVQVVVSFPLLVVSCWLFVKLILIKLLEKFDVFHEYIFLIAIGWCLGLAELFELAGLSFEIGAFIAGLTIATNPIALYIADHLKPLRDFFLVLFFFSIGAGFKLDMLSQVIIPAIVFAIAMLISKPIAFKLMLGGMNDNRALNWETGIRLGQISEFSLLVAFVATTQNLIGQEASHLIQATAILTFLVSSYLVVFKFQTPIAVNEKLRKD